MAEKQVNAVLRLRKDSENNFKRSNIILQDGELAIVSTPFSGLKIKIGDGRHRFDELNYDTIGLLVEGFKRTDTQFVYSDNATVVEPQDHLLFLDRNTGFMYYWNTHNSKYEYVNKNELATDQMAGIVKLYDSINGQNTDGAVTQAAVNVAFSRIQNAAKEVVYEMDEEDTERLNTNLSSLNALQILD